MADIFISYKSERRPAARHLKKVLECYFQTGAEDCVWYDYALIPGDDFERRLIAEISQAKVVVVLWCSMAVKSAWVTKEATEAVRTEKFLPCRIESCELPDAFSSAHTINLTAWDASPRSRHLDQLLEDIGRRLGREAISPVPKLRQLEEDWRAYGAPSLAAFARDEPLHKDEARSALRIAPDKVGTLLGVPPASITDNLRRQWENAQRGDLGALAHVGVSILLGDDGCPKNEDQAMRIFELAADQGDAQAQWALGKIYASGLGTPKNEREAVRFYKLAADQGDAEAQWDLGQMYASGSGTPKDEREAVRLYTLAAARGNANAQWFLGTMYATGNGVAKDESEAERLYKLAADQGNADAQCNLGVMYDNGQGTAKGTREAVRLYKLAVDQGHSAAQFNLGRMYESGRGIAQDDHEAMRLYKLSALQGLPEAQNELRRRGESW